MRQTRGLVHLKTAGTSYLDALRTAAAIDPALFRRIYAFSRDSSLRTTPERLSCGPAFTALARAFPSSRGETES
jgi:hypothetical protein